MTEGRLIVLSGPSGVGKGTVLARYLDRHPECRVSVSATTRCPRAGETDGVHYIYMTESEFQEKIAADGMLEWVRYNNHYYGTPCAPVRSAMESGADVVLEIEAQGALRVHSAFPQAVLIFILPPDFETLRGRLQGRGTEDPDMVQSRLRTAVDEMEKAMAYDFIIVNDGLDDAVRDMEKALNAAGVLKRSNEFLLREVLNDAKTYFNTD